MLLSPAREEGRGDIVPGSHKRKRVLGARGRGGGQMYTCTKALDLTKILNPHFATFYFSNSKKAPGSKVRVMKRLDQGHLHPKLEVPRLTCPGRDSKSAC